MIMSKTRKNWRPLMRQIGTVALFGGCVLSGCSTGSTSAGGLGWQPAIIMDGVNQERWQQDRADCENQMTKNRTNFELNDLVRFRQCLTDKGYRLMG